MSEMLGNQYFMARKYQEAVKELEPVYFNDHGNMSVRRKLIIGYIQTGKLMKGLELFTSLVKEDISFIVNADPIFDDCPCSEIIKELQPSPNDSITPDLNIYNGIIWLYCDPKISIKFLKKAIIDFPDNLGLKSTIEIIELFIKNEQKHTVSNSN